MNWFDHIWNFWYAGENLSGERMLTIINFYIFFTVFAVCWAIGWFCEEEETAHNWWTGGLIGGAVFSIGFPVVLYMGWPLMILAAISCIFSLWGENYRKIKKGPNHEKMIKDIEEIKKLIK